MADNEDWRRQRAEELKLHEADSFVMRPARERRPMVDGVETMRRPAEPPLAPIATPVASPSDAPPNKPERLSDEPDTPSGKPDTRSGEREQRPGVEPAARRQRSQAPLVSTSLAAHPAAAAPMQGVLGPAPRWSVAQHPVLFGTGIVAALAGAGALGWMLRAEIAPGPLVRPMIVHYAPSAASVRAVATPPPVSIASASTLPAQPKAVNAVQAAELKRTPPRGAAIEPLPSPSPSPPASQVLADTTPPSPKRGIATEPSRATAALLDPSSRFAHPAKAVALPGRDFSPSFNCRRAIAAVNRAICASPELSALDRQLSRNFYRATAGVDLERHKAIDRDQTDFLNERARCNSDDCVANVYRQRLDALRQSAPGD